ncbi:MAG: GAF domain-containing protein [Chloroflexi bacterium]|nr:GAF domain-containing protein [Chloroflexota bacterium]
MTIWALIPLITFLCYVALLLLTLPSAVRRVNRAFAIYLGVAAAWSFTSYVLHLNAFPGQALFWNELLVGALVGTLSTYYYFIRTYVNKSAGIGTYIGFAFTLAITAFGLRGYIVQYAYVIDGVLYHDLGASLYLIAAISITFIGAVIVHLIRRYRTAAESAERNRTLYLITGWMILIIGAYTNLIPPLARIPLDHIGSLANAIIISYAIGRYRLLDVRIVFRKGLAYSTLTVVLGALYILLLFTLQIFLHDWTELSSIALGAAFAFLVAVLLNPLKNLIQKWIDRLFYRETYDYRQVLLNFSHRISNVLDLNELTQSILDPIIKAMRIKQASLLFPETETRDFVTHFSQNSEGEPVLRLRLAADSPIVTWLEEESKPLQTELIDAVPRLKGLWESERNYLDMLQVAQLCPIMTRGNLTGILALGRKESEAAYTEEELALLMTMANEAAIALENARMLESLKNQRLQVEQLLAQVVLAQEEERKRISVDLHDSVAQWLVAASYNLQTCRHLLSGAPNGVAGEELTKMGNTLNKSLKELRRVVIGLRPPALDELGLTHALRKNVEDLQADGLEGSFSETGTPCRLPPSVEIAAYRIVQEALNNIRKHAHATKVNVTVRYSRDILSIDISDNGAGFDLSETMDSAVTVGHVGIVGMKQRAEMLGGEIKIRTGEGAGTTVVLMLPVQHPGEE